MESEFINMSHAPLKRAVQSILEHSQDYKWSVSGLGMLRTYLDEETRIHIWDSSLLVPGVTLLHTHPWSFESVVIAGSIQDHRMTKLKGGPISDRGLYDEYYIRCGAGGGVKDEPRKVRLYAQASRAYGDGHRYEHDPEDIHCTGFQEGSVTMVKRKFREDRDSAYVYAPAGEPFGNANSHPVSGLEALRIIRRSLHAWFKPNKNYPMEDCHVQG